MEPRNRNRKSPTPAARPAPPLAVARAVGSEVADCWNKIGVAGDGTCGELAKVVHCRNCPVYSTAGSLLLDREMPGDYRRDWTTHFSREKSHPAPGRNSVVIFRLGTEWLALPTAAFREIAEKRTVHSLPHRRHGVVLGLINVRGELLLCVSLANLLGIKRDDIQPATLHHRLVVAEWRGEILTFPVDEIHGIHRHQPEELTSAPATVTKGNSGFTSQLLSWENKLVGCLDAELLFSTLNRSLT